MTGLRAGELLALTVSDLDFANQTIRVNKSSDDRTREIRQPKTKQIGIGGRPGSCNDTGTECAAIQGKLGTQVLLRTVIGYEVPDKGVACAWPKAGALAAIVSRLEAKEAIAQSHQGILRNKLSVARTESFAIAPKPTTPFRRSVPGLIC